MKDLVLLLLLLANSSLSVSFALSSNAAPRHDGKCFTLHVDQATLLTTGTATLPPMVSVPCSGSLLTELIKPPNVDDLYQWYVDTRQTPDADPSWGVLWSTTVTLSEYLQDHPSLVRDKRVVELGCGLAFCGLVSAVLGAKSVLLSDREPFALHCALSTASVNKNNIDAGVVQAAVLDWTDETSTVTADVVLASDVLYDKETIDAFACACRRILGKNGGIVLVADPQKERSPGARDLFRAALGDGIEVETIGLPPIKCDDKECGSSVDAVDHAQRMQEPTVLLKCRVDVK